MFHLRLFHNTDPSSPVVSWDDPCLPRLSYSRARLPCDSLYPGYHLCLSHFPQGVELCVVWEHKALALLRAQGQPVHSLPDVCSSLAQFVEDSLQQINGSGAAAPEWSRAAQCLRHDQCRRCTRCSKHDCPSMSCFHFIRLDALVPRCPLTKDAANPEAVIKDWRIEKRRPEQNVGHGPIPPVPTDSFDAKSGRGSTGERNFHIGQASNSPKGPPSSTHSQAAINASCGSLLPGAAEQSSSMKGQTSMIPSTSVSQGERDSSSDSDEYFDCEEPIYQRDIVQLSFLDQQANDLQLEYIATRIPTTWRAVSLRLGFMKHETDRFEANHRHDVVRQAFEMLSVWKRGCAKDATNGKLRDALQESDQKSVWDDYEDHFNC